MQVYETVGAPLVRDVLYSGINALVFAYGVTNSGKTYTIYGRFVVCEQRTNIVRHT